MFLEFRWDEGEFDFVHQFSMRNLIPKRDIKPLTVMDFYHFTFTYYRLNSNNGFFSNVIISLLIRMTLTCMTTNHNRKSNLSMILATHNGARENAESCHKPAWSSQSISSENQSLGGFFLSFFLSFFPPPFFYNCPFHSE